MFYFFNATASIYFYPFSLHYFFFFFNDTATTEIYTLSLHDALPISLAAHPSVVSSAVSAPRVAWRSTIRRKAVKPEIESLDRKSTRLNSSHSQISYAVSLDRKSTRLNSSHSQISYAVFCLKKKKTLN